MTTDEDSPRNLPQVIVALTPDVRVYYAADSHMKNGDKQIMQDLSVTCGAAFLATDTCMMAESMYTFEYISTGLIPKTLDVHSIKIISPDVHIPSASVLEMGCIGPQPSMINEDVVLSLYFRGLRIRKDSKTISPTFVENVKGFLDQGWVMLGTNGDGHCAIYTAALVARLLGGPSWGFRPASFGNCEAKMAQEIRAVFLDLNQQHRWLHPREVQFGRGFVSIVC